METRGIKRLHGYLQSDGPSDTASTSQQFEQDKTKAPPPKKARKIPKIFDGKYFEMECIDAAGNIKAKCTTCNEIRSGQVTSTGNYFKHYEHKHKLKVNELKIHTKTKDENTKQRLQQPKLGEMLSTIGTDDISPYVLDFAVDGNLSFNVTQLPSFKKLLEKVSSRKILVPTRHSLMKTLDKQFVAMKNTLKDCLSKQKYLCATADGWTSRAQSYLGVTIHFINNQTFKRESYLIGFKQMQHRQTYDDLGHAIHAILLDFGISTDQLRNIVTDGGSNFCKMFKVYGQPLNASTYVNDDSGENATNHSDANETASDSVPTFMKDATGELFAAEIIDFENKNPDANSITQWSSTSELV